MGRIAEDYKYGEYKFSLEYDFGGDPEWPITIWIYKKGKPLYYSENEKYQVRRNFKYDDSIYHMKNFMNKFANNEKYRDQFINKTMMAATQ